MGIYIWLLVGMLIGLILGITIPMIFRRTSGILKIDQSNPEKDLYSFEILEDLDGLPKKKKIVLKIDTHTDLSQN